jgi:5-(carboxyamino)imidazole ribonucleotide mutase
MPLIAIVMGSQTDAPYMQETESYLDRLGIDYEAHVISAHRNPDKLRAFALTAHERGIEVIIAGAGGAAALPGALKAYTLLPVIGVPLPTSELKGQDALYSIAMLPPGIPVACMGIGNWGARNAALLAAEILALRHESVRKAYEAFRGQWNSGDRK